MTRSRVGFAVVCLALIAACSSNAPPSAGLKATLLTKCAHEMIRHYGHSADQLTMNPRRVFAHMSNGGWELQGVIGPPGRNVFMFCHIGADGSASVQLVAR